MKRTSTMTYKLTTESRELSLYADNSSEVYNRFLAPAYEALNRKVAKGTYDRDKAVDIFYRAACFASELYNKDFGYSFTVTERFTAAVEMRDYFEAEYMTAE